METDDPASSVEERLAVAQGLSIYEHPEAQRRPGLAGLAGDSGVARMVGGELHEQPVTGVALVQLAGPYSPKDAVSREIT